MLRASSWESALAPDAVAPGSDVQATESVGSGLAGEIVRLEGGVAVRRGGNGGISDPSNTAAENRARAAAGQHDPDGDSTGELFRSFATRVYGYVRLRTTADLADDVVADTFLTAWRLRESVPEEPLPWLLVIARNALANRQRSAKRGTRLVVAMARVADLARHADAAEDIAVDRAAVLAALAALRAEDREALLLIAWDGLAAADAATVAGCSERTFARRLRRARSQLSAAETGWRTTPAQTDTCAVQNLSKES